MQCDSTSTVASWQKREGPKQKADHEQQTCSFRRTCEAIGGNCVSLEYNTRFYKELQAQVPDGSDGSEVSQTKDAAFSDQALRPADKINGLVARDFWLAISQEVTTHRCKMNFGV